MEIKRMTQNPAFNPIHIIQDYQQELLKRRDRLNILIDTVEKTVRSRKGLMLMNDQEKFAGLRAEMLRENDEKYGDEINMEYGKEAVKESKRIFLDMKPADFEAMNRIGQEIKTSLEKAVLDHEDPNLETGKRIAGLHKEWLSYTWPKYSVQAHAGLVGMYVEDERFSEYYDQNVKGCAEFLRLAVLNLLK
ncbi:MAG: TipAS antibiotic-recognition domain-containing protein [Erysipelotrichaceae bacterium]